MDYEDALAAAQEHNAQLQKLIAFLQQSIETFQTTQHGLIEQIRTLTQQQEQERDAAAARIAELEAMIRRLTGQIDALLVRLGDKEPPTPPRKRAKKDPKTAPSSDEDEDGDGEKKTRPHPNHHPHGRSGPPAHLERDEVAVGVEGACPHCGHDRLHQHDTQVSEAYDYVRGYVRARRIVRQVCRCAGCRKRVTAPMPPMPFSKVACTFEVMAYLVVMKLVLFVPLDRLGRDFAAQGAPLGAAMLSRWFHECGRLLSAVVEQMRQELLSGDHLRFDGTGLTLIDYGPTDRRPVIHGQVIVFCTEQLVLFHPTETKHGKHIEAFLTVGTGEDARPWQGTATADAVNIHDQIFAVPGRIEAGCNAHGLRKFRDDADCAPLLAEVALGFIGGWYRVEKDARDQGLAGAELLAHRQAHAGPLAEQFRTWLDDFVADPPLSAQNPVFKAVGYYDRHWSALTQFLRDPEVDLDNNLSERLLRNVALLRKNALFSGSGAQVERMCGLLSVVQTCRLLKIDPYDYLVWSLPKLVVHPDNRGRNVADLTPAAYKRHLGAAEGFG